MREMQIVTEGNGYAVVCSDVNEEAEERSRRKKMRMLT